VGPKAGLEGCGKSRPHRDSIPGKTVGIPFENPCCYMYTLRVYTCW